MHYWDLSPKSLRKAAIEFTLLGNMILKSSDVFMFTVMRKVNKENYATLNLFINCCDTHQLPKSKKKKNVHGQYALNNPCVPPLVISQKNSTKY